MDGDGEPAFEASVIDRARDVVSRLIDLRADEPIVSPGRSGEVVIYLECGRNLLELEIRHDGFIDACLYDSRLTILECFKGMSNVDEALKWVLQLIVQSRAQR